MAVHRIQMPQLGETVAEATIVSWLKQPGDPIAEQEALLEVATDKVDTDVPSTVAGVVGRLLVEEGETVDVGTVIAEIETSAPGAEPAADDDGAAAPAPVAPAERSATGAARTHGTGAVGSLAAGPAGGDPDPPGATGSLGSTLPPPVDGNEPVGARGRHPSQLVSPLVRRLIAENDLDLDELIGQAGGGRVSRAVVMRALRSRGTQPAAEPAVPAEAPDPAVRAHAAPSAAGREATGELVPFSRIRARTAEHMVTSLRTSAHVLSAIEVDFEQVARLRAARRSSFPDRFGAPLTYLAFVATATVRALRDARRLNAKVEDSGLRLHPDVNLGIAVDLDGEGLVVPVIPRADRLTLAGMAQAVAGVAAKARSGSLRPDDVSGGTFTISSQGPYGTLLTGAIINQPQVAVLSVDGIRKRPVVVEHEGADAIVAHHTGVLGLSWDHRAIDGLYAGRFLATLRDRIEGTDWAAELD